MTARELQWKRLISKLNKIRSENNPALKIKLLDSIASMPFPNLNLTSSKWILQLHELLLFLYAYPDNEKIFLTVSSCLKKLRSKIKIKSKHFLDDSGIINTSLTNTFDFPIAKWLAEKYPQNAEIAWDLFEDDEPLQNIAPILSGASEELGIDDENTSIKQWFSKASGKKKNLTLLTQRIAKLNVAPKIRDHLYDSMKIPIRWKLLDPQSSRTNTFLPHANIYYHKEPLLRNIPDVLSEIKRQLPIFSRQICRENNSIELLDLAKSALSARLREMFPISHGNLNNINLYTLERGLSILTIGILPERRLPLESLWGFLFLKNGLPLGYGCFSSLFGCTEIAANVFDTFRGGESAWIYIQLLRVIRHHTEAKALSIMNSQIGHNDEEGIKSGAFWFYYKLGFRPINEEHLKLVEAERMRIKNNPDYRSSPNMLRKLAKKHLHLKLEDYNVPLLGETPYAKIGFAVTELIASHYDGSRESAVKDARKAMSRILGAKISNSILSNELILIAFLVKDEIKKWNRQNRIELVRLINAKSSSSEQLYTMISNRHLRWQKALLHFIQSH